MNRRNGNSSCSGKKVFTSWYAAQRSANQLNKFREGAKANVYKCNSCKSFHVGNSMGTMKHRRPSRHTLKGIAKHGGI